MYGRAMAPTVLLGWNATPPSYDALTLARQLAQARDARLLVACVYAVERGSVLRDSRYYERALREEAEDHLAEARAALGTDADAEYRAVASRSPAEALHRLAEAEADLIVVGSSHRGAMGRVLVGSVAERLLSGSPVPVAIAPRGLHFSPAPALKTIGVAYGPGAEADEALRAAVELAERASARLRIVSVLTPAEQATLRAAARHGESDWAREARADARERLDAAVRHAEARVPADGELVEDDAVHALAAAGAHLDLLVLGSRAYGPARTVLVGSTSHRLVREAPCPLLVVPRGTASAEGPPASGETATHGVDEPSRPIDE